MGFHSWITSDTRRSIPAVPSERLTFPVYMITEDQQIFYEPEYEGYGRFGGKPFYELVGELNEERWILTGGDAFDNGIELIYRTILKHPRMGKHYIKGIDFTNWEIPLHEGLTPNQMAAGEWETYYPFGYGNYEQAAQSGLKVPKIVETVPVVDGWEEFWKKLPDVASCPAQGYFY